MEQEGIDEHIAELANLDDQQFVEIISDTISYLSGVKVPFIKKYASVMDPVKILKVRSALSEIFS